MKIDPTKIDQESFKVVDGVFCGEEAFLITPALQGTKWSKENLVLRSSVWSKKTNELLSAGFPKFFNYGEKPDLYPDPEKYKDWIIDEKLDGTLTICDFVNNQISMRTRGTFSYKTQENFFDFEKALGENTGIVKFLMLNPNYSLLCELVTPFNVIVINYNEVKFILIGAINKNDYSLLKGEELDEIGGFTQTKRPKRYNFNTLSEIVQTTKEWKGKEGVVLSYNKGQNLVKMKSDWYNYIHRMKSQLNTLESFLDLYLDYNEPSYQDFFKTIEDVFDFEIAQQSIGTISKLAETKKEVDKIINGMKNFVENRKNKTRKEIAKDIIDSYSDTNRASFCFIILDGKSLEKKEKKKLYFQLLK